MLSRVQKIRGKRTTALLIGLFVVVFLFLAVGVVWAQQTDLNLGLAPASKIGLGGEDIRVIIAKIIRAVLGLLGVIALSIIIYAGFIIMVSEGQEEKIIQGKKILINAVIGLVIIFSALAIVQFVLNALLKATNYAGVEGTVKPKMDTFAGSGALGKIIKDHYPMRDQTDVPRNTKIIVTFSKPILPESIIENTNHTCWNQMMTGPTAECVTKDGAPVTENTKLEDIMHPYYGDCLTKVVAFDWQKHCDHLKVNSVHIYKSGDEAKTPVLGAAMASYQGKENEVYTFVFKPFEFLGNSLENVWYTVWLSNDILKKSLAEEEVAGAFSDQFYPYYYWEFQTNTLFDYTPPYVVDVYPKDEVVPRNTIVQLQFSEAMDPLMVQGALKDGYSFANLIFNKPTVTGEWTVSNGYKTVEFVSDKPCGLNSCGDEMYCIALDCKAGDKECVNDLYALVRTGEKIQGGEAFEAVPLSGVMDSSGNALDGNKNDLFEGKPVMGVDEQGGFKAIGAQEMKMDGDKAVFTPDDYGWQFKVINKIDRTAPNVEKVLPGLDEYGVGGDAKVSIKFNRRMWVNTLSDIFLEEYPQMVDQDGNEVSFFFFVQAKSEESAGIVKAVAEVGHREFGPNDVDAFYFPEVPSTVKSLNQNCLYPGRGPVIYQKADRGESPVCEIKGYDENGSPILDLTKNCVPVDVGSKTDTGCIETSTTVNGDESLNTEKMRKGDIKECSEHLKTNS